MPTHSRAIDIDDQEYFDARTYACPECERPTQFGELCFSCQREIAEEANEASSDAERA